MSDIGQDATSEATIQDVLPVIDVEFGVGQFWAVDHICIWFAIFALVELHNQPVLPFHINHTTIIAYPAKEHNQRILFRINNLRYLVHSKGNKDC